MEEQIAQLKQEIENLKKKQEEALNLAKNHRHKGQESILLDFILKENKGKTVVITYLKEDGETTGTITFTNGIVTDST